VTKTFSIYVTCVLKLASNKPNEQRTIEMNKTVLASIIANNNCPTGASTFIKTLHMVITNVSWNDKLEVPANCLSCSK
jgi:hypothetical protein